MIPCDAPESHIQSATQTRYVAHLLIAVNPLKKIANPPEADFEGAKSLSSLPPHQFAIAESAYRALLLPPAVRQDQSVVVSGESGAGQVK